MFLAIETENPVLRRIFGRKAALCLSPTFGAVSC